MGLRRAMLLAAVGATLTRLAVSPPHGETVFPVVPHPPNTPWTYQKSTVTFHTWRLGFDAESRPVAVAV
jgi:hypothetical protein